MNLAQLTPEAVALLNTLGGAAFKDAGTTPGTMLHGPGGLLSTPGLNRGIVNAMITPRGLAGRLKVRPSIYTNEIIPILTGLTTSTGSENTTACADAPVVGTWKTCQQTHVFGRMSRESQVLQLDRLGQLVNRGEFRDNVLIGSPAVDPGSIPGGAINWTRALQSEYEAKLAALYLGYFRDFARLVYTGNPANTAGNTGYQEYNGLDILINRNKRDAITGQLCPAADSIVFDFNGTNASTSGSTVYDRIANVVTNLERLAEQTGMNPVEWAISMRYGAFWALTNIWPCVYATVGCGVNTVIRTESLTEATAMRDDMRNNRYLLIEGKRYEVIIDDSIIETVPGAIGTYESDIYFVPLRGAGQELTYFEYFNLQEEAVAAASQFTSQGSFTVLEGGRFLFHRKPPSNECVQARITERPRLVLQAPFLAARFTNLRYNITVHERDAFPSEPYFVNGGGTTQPQPYFYPPLP